MRLTHVEPLLNSSSKSMSVNGSSVAKVFSYGPRNRSEAVIGLVCIFSASGATSWDKFGALTALSNGVLIGANLASSDYQIANIKDNQDITLTFYDNQFGNSAVNSLGDFIGFGNASDTFMGFLPFSFPNNHLMLDDGDTIQVTIQDDLRTISYLSMAAIVVREI